VNKYVRTTQAADDNIIRCMRFAFCVIKATDTYSEYVIFIASLQQNGFSLTLLDIRFLPILPILLNKYVCPVTQDVRPLKVRPPR